MKHFTSVRDVENVKALVRLALDYKSNPRKDKELGAGTRIGLLFLNPSMRTRLSTQIAASNLGMDSIVFNVGQDGWNLEFEDNAIMNGTTVEHIKDAAPILGNYFDMLGIRTFPALKNKEEDYSERILQQFIRYAGVPIVNLESATLHPLQSLTDIVTISETFSEKRKPKIVLAWAPHVKALPQCVPNSFAQWINTWGEADFVIAHPKGYELDNQFVKGATIVNDLQQGVEGADIVYVKNWSAVSDYGKILGSYPEWMLTSKSLKMTNHAKIMHCLPVRRNVELDADVLDGPQSVVTVQASNRIWAAQAVLSELLRKKK